VKKDIISKQCEENNTKIIMVVLDGLGDIPSPANDNKTPLETAKTPNIDKLAPQSAMGRLTPVIDGITPGSGPAHLALFGYDPLEDLIGRGVLEAFGLGVDVGKNDVAIRANFCTVGSDGKIEDRRAGRIPTELGQNLCRLLSGKIKSANGVNVLITPGMSHRFAVVLKGKGLGNKVTDTDPQHEGMLPLKATGQDAKSKKTANVANILMEKFKVALKDSYPANGVLFRGFSSPPNLISFPERFNIKAAAIATYPMYKGLAQIVGMDIIKSGSTLRDEIEALKTCYSDFGFFYFHIKETDAGGEDGDLERKVSGIEKFDKALPEIMELKPDVLAITGDHSTPVIMKRHSWHPVPVMVLAKDCFRDGLARFTEKNCIVGSIGSVPMLNLMPLLLAHAGRLGKYGA